jgi:hypothetical protein
MSLTPLLQETILIFSWIHTKHQPMFFCWNYVLHIFKVRLLHKVCTIKVITQMHQLQTIKRTQFPVYSKQVSHQVHTTLYSSFWLFLSPYVHQSQMLIFTIPELQFLVNWHSSVCNGMFWMRTDREVVDMHNIQLVLDVWVLMHPRKSLFWCFRGTYYLPPFLGNNPVQVHATVIWKKEWVILHNWGDSGQSEL